MAFSLVVNMQSSTIQSITCRYPDRTFNSTTLYFKLYDPNFMISNGMIQTLRFKLYDFRFYDNIYQRK